MAEEDWGADKFKKRQGDYRDVDPNSVRGASQVLLAKEDDERTREMMMMSGRV